MLMCRPALLNQQIPVTNQGKTAHNGLNAVYYKGPRRNTMFVNQFEEVLMKLPQYGWDQGLKLYVLKHRAVFSLICIWPS